MPDLTKDTMKELNEALEKQAAFTKNCRDILLAFDDGPRSCTGILSSGELVWKGSFIAFMERMRDALPPETP